MSNEKVHLYEEIKPIYLYKFFVNQASLLSIPMWPSSLLILVFLSNKPAVLKKKDNATSRWWFSAL